MFRDTREVPIVESGGGPASGAEELSNDPFVRGKRLLGEHPRHGIPPEDLIIHVGKLDLLISFTDSYKLVDARYLGKITKRHGDQKVSRRTAIVRIKDKRDPNHTHTLPVSTFAGARPARRSVVSFLRTRRQRG